MHTCGICKRRVGDHSGCYDLIRGINGRLHKGKLCSACCPNDASDVTTLMLVKTAVGFTTIALLCSLMSYLILGFM